ncbi:MAG TPA: glycosyltransferase family A protein, partial [Candidatus Binatia bacterium]|nr:glycosyltransferase family A protein [Candidatus Binatia bacterium]
MATISVIVPTYDAAPYLRESLDSLLVQSTPEVEVLVVDDGSTDDTPAILASYGDRLRVIRGSHEGYPVARNLGVTHATGEWIAFHDADDVALPDRLAFQRDFVGRHPGCDAVFCNGERMDTGAALVPAPIAGRAVGRRLGPADVFEGFPVYFQAALVRRSAFATVGPFDRDLPI